MEGKDAQVEKVWGEYCASRNTISKIVDSAKSVVSTETHRVRDSMFLFDELSSFVRAHYPNDENLKKIIATMYQQISLSAKQSSVIEDGFVTQFGALSKGLITDINNIYSEYVRVSKGINDQRLKYDVIRSSRVDPRVSQLETEISSNELIVAHKKSEFFEKTAELEKIKGRVLAECLVQMISEQQRCLMYESTLLKSLRPVCLDLKFVQEEVKIEKSSLLSISYKPYISKRGYVQLQKRKGGWKKIWMTVDEGVCCLWPSHRSPNPKKRMDLAICRAAPLSDSEGEKGFGFIVQSPEKSLTISSLDKKQREEWLESLKSNISYCLRCSSDGKVLQEKFNYTSILMERCRDFVCGDCGSPRPEWAIINLGLPVCHECAGVHRSFGVHISRVRSLTMDHCHSETIEAILLIGRNLVSSIFLSNCPEDVLKKVWKTEKPMERSIREDYLRQKYIEKDFIHPSLRCEEIPTHREIFETCTENDFSKYLILMARGLNLGLLEKKMTWVEGKKKEKKKKESQKEEGEGKDEEDKKGEEEKGYFAKEEIEELERAVFIKSKQERKVKAHSFMYSLDTAGTLLGDDYEDYELGLSESFSNPLKQKIPTPRSQSFSFSKIEEEKELREEGEEGEEREKGGKEEREEKRKGKRIKKQVRRKSTHVKRKKRTMREEEKGGGGGEEDEKRERKKRLSRKFGLPLIVELVTDGRVNLVMLDLLIQGGLGFDVKVESWGGDPSEHNGWTVLHFAASFDRADYCSFFLERGANPNEPAEDGQTPLDIARAHGYHECVAALLGRKEKKSKDLSAAAIQKQVREDCGDALELLKAKIIILRHKFYNSKSQEEREKILVCIDQLDQIMSRSH